MAGDGLRGRVTALERYVRNQGLVIVALLALVFLMLSALVRKGVLAYGDLVADG